MKKKRNKTKKIKSLWIVIISLAFVAISCALIYAEGLYEDSGQGAGGMDKYISWYKHNAEILETNSFGAMAIRTIVQGATHLITMIVSASEKLYDTAFGFVDMTSNETVNNFILQFKPILVGLMALSIFYLGVILVMNHEKKPQIGINVAIMVLCISCSTVLFSELNGLAGAFKQGADSLDFGGGIKSETYKVIDENMVDIVKLSNSSGGLYKVNFASENKKKKNSYYGAGIKNKEDYAQINYIDVMNPNSGTLFKKDKGNPKATELLSYRIVSVGNGNEYTTFKLRNGIGWNSEDDADIGNEFYYRYYFNTLTAWLQLIALAIVFLSMSYKCTRVAFELIVGRLLAYLYSVELSGGEKIKKILVFIRDSYILLAVTLICIKVFSIMNTYVSAHTDGIIKGLFSLFVAFCVIDGPNLVEKLLGMDAGLKSSTARMMAIGGAAIGAAKMPGKSIAKGAAAYKGNFERGGIAGAAVAATLGQKRNDGSGKRTGGIAGLIRKAQAKQEGAGSAAGARGRSEQRGSGFTSGQEGRTGATGFENELRGETSRDRYSDALRKTPEKKSNDFMNKRHNRGTTGGK